MKTARILAVAARAEVPLSQSNSPGDLMKQLLAAAEADEDVCLDILDATLATGTTQHRALEQVLQDGRSMWMVADSSSSLQERVDQMARLSFKRATEPPDLASEELAHAWSKTFGRDADPSDTWDHAIKAVEAVLTPLVVPNQAKAHLGHVVGTLDRQGELFALEVGNPDGIKVLVSMLRLLWPNPDRHASPIEWRLPSDKEARAVLHLAITIVQWVRDGLLQRV